MAERIKMGGQRISVIDVNKVISAVNKEFGNTGYGFYLKESRYPNGTKSYGLCFGSIDDKNPIYILCKECSLRETRTFCSGVTAAFRAMKSTMAQYTDKEEWIKFIAEHSDTIMD